MFWTTIGNQCVKNGAVYSAELDGSNIELVVPTGTIHTSKQCVVDRQARKLYICDHEGLRVMRVNVDGLKLETLVQTGDWHDPSQIED